MTTATFDTLTASRQLEAAGIEPRQAEAIVIAIRQSGEAVATKADIDGLEATTKADTAGVKAEIQAVKAEIFRALWIQGLGLIGAFAALVGAGVAILKLLEPTW